MGKIKFHNDIVQGSQEWLELREGRVTCSNALTVMNRGKSACLFDNHQAAVRLKPNGNAYAERGHVIEHEFKEKFNETLSDMGLYLDECGFITNSDYPMAGYSPDGLIRDLHSNELVSFAEFKAYNDLTNNGTKVSLSCKHRRACRSVMDVPPECIAQCNMAMIITETDCMYLFLCNPDADKANNYIQTLKALAEHGNKEAAEELKKKIPDGDYDWEIPVTHIHKIFRDEAICNRIIEGLSR